MSHPDLAAMPPQTADSQPPAVTQIPAVPQSPSRWWESRLIAGIVGGALLAFMTSAAVSAVNLYTSVVTTNGRLESLENLKMGEIRDKTASLEHRVKELENEAVIGNDLQNVVSRILDDLDRLKNEVNPSITQNLATRQVIQDTKTDLASLEVLLGSIRERLARVEAKLDGNGQQK